MSTRDYLALMWQRRDFIAAVPLGELRAQNQNTALGNVWHLLNPLLLAGVYYLVFGVLFDTRGGDYDNYAGYLIVGVFSFTYLNKATISGARTVTSNRNLIQTIAFPRAALPLSAVIVELLSQGYALMAMLPLVWMTGTPPRWSWLLLPLAVAIQTIFNMGAAFFVARAAFHFADVQQVLPYIFRLWMYVSGLVFPLELILRRTEPLGLHWVATVFQWNPAYLFISLWRTCVVGDVGPPVGAAPLWYWGAALLWAVVILVTGFLWFRAHESEYAGG